MATEPIPGTQNLGAVSGCIAFGAGGGTPKAFKQWLPGSEALGLYDLKGFFRGVKFKKIGSYLSRESPDQFTESH